jgi:glucose/arabinose dehydrogenase
MNFRNTLVSIGFALLLQAGSSAQAEIAAGVDPRNEDPRAIEKMYAAQCAVCHGDRLQGAAQGVPLVGVALRNGEEISDLEQSIAVGAPAAGMPAWNTTLSDVQIRSLAIFIVEQRIGFETHAFRVSDSLTIPSAPVKSELHTFRVDSFLGDLDPLPYTIAPLPEGGFLLTEKYIGLSVISAAGERQLVTGTPRIAERSAGNLVFGGLNQSTGWMLGVALHPDYAENGWVYLAHGDICDDCPRTQPDVNEVPTMTRIIRGRIRNGAWVDSETIWSVAKQFYNQYSDMMSGGIMAFDASNHLYFMVGVKKLNDGVQELDQPFGKIHRIHDDGRIPADNPYIDKEGAIKSTWSYGHRNPQGLEFNDRTNELWSSEHGPRGGDEINRIMPGRNYGWPLYSLGVNYDGTKIDDGKRLGIEWEMDDIEQPRVNFTPSPALSAFVTYHGDLFPEWQDNLIVGSLRARKLYRVVLKDGVEVHRETLLSDIGRIRDVKVDAEGLIWLLIEHPDGSHILKLSPEGRSWMPRWLRRLFAQ